jgi:hypothetical protein
VRQIRAGAKNGVGSFCDVMDQRRRYAAGRPLLALRQVAAGRRAAGSASPSATSRRPAGRMWPPPGPGRPSRGGGAPAASRGYRAGSAAPRCHPVRGAARRQPGAAACPSGTCAPGRRPGSTRASSSGETESRSPISSFTRSPRASAVAAPGDQLEAAFAPGLGRGANAV